MKRSVLVWLVVLGLMTGMENPAWAFCGGDGSVVYSSLEDDTSTCSTPYGLSVSNLSGTYAMLIWEYDTVNGEAPGFTLIVTDSTGTEFGLYNLDGSDRSYILLDLNERTTYHVQLSVDCEGADTVELDFTTVCNSGGERQIGTGTSTNSYLPSYLFATSSISQQLFTADELEGVVAIEGFKVYMTSSSATADRQWDVFLDTTSRSSYSSVNDYITPSMAHRHFSGSVSFSQGWVTVVLDSAFSVPVDKNVVLTIHDKTGTSGSSRSFRTTATTDTMSIYGYSITDTLNATSASAFLGATSNVLKRRNTIKLMTSCDVGGCVAPIIVSAVPASHSVTLTWLVVGTETEWKVEYRTGTGAWIESTPSTTSTTYTVMGLASTTTYAFRVTSLCGGEEASRTTTATTLCGAEPVPFSEGFEVFLASSNDTQLKPCWYRGSNNPSTYLFYPSRTSGCSHSGNYSIAMGGYRGYLVLPLMDASIDSLSLGFYAHNNDIDVPAELEVGVCTDPSDTNTFAVIATYEVSDTGWIRLETDLEYYTGAEGHLFIRVHRNEGSSLFIDDLSVNYLPDCRRVTDVTVSNLTSSSATLTIADSHNYGNYIVYYATVNDTAFADTIHVSGTTVTLTGLNDNTQYYVWVVARCSASSVGRAFIVPPFRTACLPVVVTATEPYLEEFGSEHLECMTQESVDRLRWRVVLGNEIIHCHSGNRMVAVASSDNRSAMLVLPTFDFSGMTEDAELTFYHNQYHPVEDTVTPIGQLQVYYRLAFADAWTLLATVDSSINTWQRMDCTLPSSQGTPFYQVALKGSPRGNSTGLCVDDITVGTPPTCPRPSNVQVRDISDRSATVAWTGNAPAYRVQYRPVGTLSWAQRTVENADTVVITPLNMATRYEVRVATLCSVNDMSENSLTVVFTTDICANRIEGTNHGSVGVPTVSTVAPVNTAVGYSYTEILVDSATLSGMTEIDGMAFYVAQVGSASYMTNCQLYMGHAVVDILSAFQYDSTYLMVFDGDISATVMGERQIRFTTPFVWDGHRNVVLGIMYTTPDYGIHGVTRFVAHQTLVDKVYHGGSSWYPITPAPVDSLLDEYGGSNLVPNLTFYECLPTCHEPVVNTIVATATSITVDWYDENAIVEIQIKEASATNWDSPEVVNANQTNIHSYTYEYLSEMTDYTIRLRADCSNEETGTSGWVQFNVRTDTICSIPDNLSVTVIDAGTAQLSWNDGPMSSNVWELHVWNNNFNNYYTVTSNPVTIDDLMPSSNYRAAVRAHCGSNDHVVGEWSDDLVFDNVCYPVSGLQAQINGNDVVLTWNPGERNQRWVVTYGYVGFDLNDQLGYMIVNTNSATISGLAAAAGMTKGSAGTTFGFRVRAICADGWNSTWSSEASVHFVGIDDVEGADAQVSLQPNPATELVNLHIEGLEGKVMVSVISVDGRQLQRFETADSDLGIDVSNMAAGTYFVRVQTSRWTTVRKMLVR